MIKFRQKDFALPAFLAPLFTANGLMTSSMIGGTAISAVQGHKAAKASEEQHEQMLAAQKRENAKLTKALNNLAEQAKNNPQAAIQAGQLVGQSRMYSISSGLKNVARFGREVVGAAGGKTKIGKTLVGMGMAGAATGLVGYATDKAITADARKIGLMPQKQKTYSGASVLSKSGDFLKRMGKHAISKENLKSVGGWAAFGVVPAVGYAAQRKQYKDQQKAASDSLSPVQKSYSWAGMKSITGGISRLGSFGMIGRRDVQKFGERLTRKGMSPLANKAGNFIKKHQNIANLTVGLTGGSAIVNTYNAGEKLAKAGAKAVDKDAFAYENFSQNKKNVE